MVWNNHFWYKKTLTGSVSGTHTITTHGSTTGSFVEKSVSVTSVRWSVSTGHSVTLFYNGGTVSQDIGYFTGGGVWDSSQITFIPVGMGSGNSISYCWVQYKLETFK